MHGKPSRPENDVPKYWFPAKRYGWGWGFPITWQGWLTMALFVFICFVSAWLGRNSVVMMATGILLAAIFLLAICLWKGEPPHWNWGNNNERK